MKKARIVLTWLLFAMTILYPAGYIIASFLGYRFELKSIPVFAGAIAVLSAIVVVSDIVCEKLPATKAMQIMLAVIAPISIINEVFYILSCQGFPANLAVTACMLFSVGCCCYLTVRYGKPKALKIASLVLSALMIVPVCILSFFNLVWGDFGKTEVVQTIESPSGKYYAEVIDNDEGAFGGDTYVRVCEKNAGLDMVLFKIEKWPQTVYEGEWGDFMYMDIHWKDDGCLVIDSVEYDIH